MICTNCRRRLRSDATSCLCGKFGQESQVRRPHIQCCVEGCQNSANVKVWTKTGWANVCARVNAGDLGTYHYEQIEQVPRVTSNPYMDELRAARRNGPKKIPEAIGNIIPRQPGEDREEPALGIPIDDLEREFADRANP